MPGIEYIWFANVQTAHRCLSQFAPLTNTAEELTLEETITNTSTSYFLSRPPKRYPLLRTISILTVPNTHEAIRISRIFDSE